MKIPILNIYYLLSYAWNKLDEAQRIRVGISDYDQIVDLFAKLLINGCNRLLKQGLDRDYLTKAERYNGIKGKIDFTASLNANLFSQGMAACEFDEFEPDVIQNQIIKATLWRLSKVTSLDSALRLQVILLIRRFQLVTDITLSPSSFIRVRIHRNNSFYQLLIHVCRMIYDATTLNEKNGEYEFMEFMRDERKMAFLFEEFVRNFYQREMAELHVSRPDIEWDAVAVGASDIELLPRMHTDICIDSSARRIIIDTKYYGDTTSSYRGGAKFHSPNLYQLYSYLRNLETDDSSPRNINASGILLYPTVAEEYNHSYVIGGHNISIHTVDLARDWREIDSRLKEIIA